MLRDQTIRTGGQFSVDLARDAEEIEETQRLRYQVFVEEMGAKPDTAIEGIERDHFDDYCHHLLVRHRPSGRVVATTRILTDTQSRLAGGFYSESEFDLGDIRALPGRIMEIGRTCVHADYRNGATMARLWSGLADFMESYRLSYLIGCCSIPLNDCGVRLNNLMDRIRHRHMSDESLRVRPRLGLRERLAVGSSEIEPPPLLKAYLRLGAKVCGEPCWDPVFNTADLFILLDTANLTRRYQRHFIQRQRSLPAHEMHAQHSAA